MTMKIVYIITGLNCGGAENLLLSICKNNNKTGKEQLVIYLTKTEFLLSEFNKENINTLFIDEKKLGAIRTIIRIKKELKSFNPDIVNTHLVMADTLGRAACLFIKNVKVFTTIHNMDEWKLEKKFSYKLLKLYNKITINCFSKNKLIAVSENCKKFCIENEKIKPEKISILYNYVLEDKTGESVKRETLGLKKDDFVFVNVGRMEIQKQQIDILKVAIELKKRKVNNIKFIIIGDGSLHKQLEEYIINNDLSDIVILVGFVKNVYNYYFISNMMLFTSSFEGFGLVIWEAFYNKLPVLATDIPTTTELIINGETGVLYEVGAISELADKIEDILNGKYDLKNMADKAHKFCMNCLDYNYFDKLYEIYETK